MAEQAFTTRMIRYQLERAAFALFLLITGIFPRSVVLATGRAFGKVAFYLDRRHRRVAIENLQTAFPDWDSARIQKTLRQCYSFFGHYLFDILHGLSRSHPQTLNDFEQEGLEYYRRAYESGKGVIFFTAHWGGWEWMALAFGNKQHPLGLVVRRLDNPYLERLLERFRTAGGNFLIDKKEGFRPMLKALREGKGIALLIDQNVTTEDRVFVEFFGKPASTTPALALLKLKTDCALVPVFALPIPHNRYRFIFGKPVEVELTGERKKDMLTITQECTRILEEQIRKYPAYWLWMHRRWKTRPEEMAQV